MPNFFSKVASQNGTLKLFAGGRQIKSLVPLIDVARCFKFMESRNDLNFDIFNLTKDTISVKEVADICKKIVGYNNLYIATDSKKIENVVIRAGYKSIITSKKCLTGTDRVAEVAKKIRADIYINVQATV